MSNLGLYQEMTTYAKKVGGPLQFVGILVGSGAVIGGAIATSVNVISKKVKKHIEDKNKRLESEIIYKVTCYGCSNEGLVFDVGDTFRVLESDGDAVLIEKIGNANNPYFVSKKFLNTISDYK